MVHAQNSLPKQVLLTRADTCGILGEFPANRFQMKKMEKNAHSSKKITGYFTQSSKSSTIKESTVTKRKMPESPNVSALGQSAAAAPKGKKHNGAKSGGACQDLGDGEQTLQPEVSGGETGVPDIGCVVKAKVNEKWFLAQIVKHERWGISQKYAVKALVVVFDNDHPKSKVRLDRNSNERYTT
jgi:hypothetical protein